MRKILVGLILLVSLLHGLTEITTAQVTPKVDFSPKSGFSGSSVGVQGSGFTPNTFVRIFLGESQVAIVPADMEGRFWASFTAREEGKILARDSAGKEAVAEEEFRLIPRAQVEPWRTIVGKLVIVKGSGFPKNKRVLIYFEGREVSSVFLANRHDFETSFLVPLISGGSKFLELKDENLATLTRANFYVEPQTISVYPSQGRIGTLVTVTGSGFLASSSVAIQFAEKSVTSGLTDYNGYFRTQFIVPVLEPGSYGIVAISGPIRVLSIFEVLRPNLSLSSLQVKPGEKLTVKVEGATPFSPVRIFIGELEITPIPGLMISRDGSLNVEVTIPGLRAGDYSLKVLQDRLEISQLITILPESPGKIERALSSISQYLVRVWGYDGGKWRLYDPAIPPEFNDLKELEKGKGYLIKVKEDCELISGGQIHKLNKGWNLIGWFGE